MATEPLVKDVMRTQFLSILPGATVRSAVEMLYRPAGEESNRSMPDVQSLMVQESDGKLVGLVTLFDLIEGIEPQYMRLEQAHLAVVTWEGLFEEAIDLAENRLVSDIMTPRRDFHVLRADDPLMKALELMAEEKTPRLPVCDGERVIGMVRLTEIFQEVAREMLRPDQGTP